mgnify:CR=1 FL=1
MKHSIVISHVDYYSCVKLFLHGLGNNLFVSHCKNIFYSWNYIAATACLLNEGIVLNFLGPDLD